MAEQYIYAVTSVHMHEKGLLSAQDLAHLADAESPKDVYRFLSEKGWGSPELPAEDADALVAYELDKTWALVTGLLEDLSPFDVFRVANDYHNLKAAIKLAYSADVQQEGEGCFLPYGTAEVALIKKAAETHDFSLLPQGLAQAGREAYLALSHTGSGQACDIVIDRAALVAIDAAGKQCESVLLQRYAELTVDVANIKTAVRGCRMGKNRDFINRAIPPVGSLDTEKLAAAAASGMEKIYECLKYSAYAGAVDELKKSVTAFERWCDNQLIALIKPQKNNYFTLEPLAAFILGRENEIKMVRLILSAKTNNVAKDVLAERLRDTYV